MLKMKQMVNRRAVLALWIWVGYVLAFIPLYHLAGPIMAALAVLPVVATGWLWGMRAGLLASLLTFPLNMLLMTLVTGTAGDMMTSGGLFGSVVMLLIGAAVGRLHDMGEQVKQELTERKQAEREIQERQMYLEALLRAAPDAIVTLDASQRIVEWNPGAERLFGYSREEVINQSLDPLVTNPDTFEEAVAFTQIAMSGKDLPPVETVRHRKNGSPVDVIAAGSPILVEDEFIGVVAVYTDITKRKRAEQALRQSEERYRTLVENQGEGVGFVDPEECFTFANPAAHEIFGVTQGELVGRRLREFVDPETFDLVRAQTEKRRGGEKSVYRYLLNIQGGMTTVGRFC